jgi:REP element-mobilizing transposase RayT
MWWIRSTSGDDISEMSSPDVDLFLIKLLFQGDFLPKNDTILLETYFFILKSLIMAITSNFKARLTPGNFYHSYNRTNNGEFLFRKKSDYILFMNKMKKYLKRTVDIMAFNLLPNHFHLIYKVRTVEEIIQNITNNAQEEEVKAYQLFLLSKKRDKDVNILITNEFRRLFISYAGIINHKHKRKGNLLYRSFKTVHLKTDARIRIGLRYVNCNAIKHKLAVRPEEYQWSSYLQYLDEDNAYINTELGFSLFHSREEFIAYHNEFHALYSNVKVIKKRLRKSEKEVFI